ncbi:MAG: usg protein [Ancalomicrobiaceae bacterium]|nr:usg protein [Ancalomicrobiaceae bacterium]
MRQGLVDADFRRQIEGYGLTTANILYRLPDHPGLLQSYLWQNYDLAPKFPELERFLDFWNRELEGPIHSVEVAHSHLVRPGDWRHVNGLYRMQ